MEDFSELVRKSKKFKNDKEERYSESSKDRLSKISKKKIQTTMIGALSSIETKPLILRLTLSSKAK